MKKIIIVFALLILAGTSYSQVVYSITQVTHKQITNGVAKITIPIKSVTIKTTADLFSDALILHGDIENYFKFARKINANDNEGGYTLWKAIDKYDQECEVVLKDYGTYSQIGVAWTKTGKMVLYQTL